MKKCRGCGLTKELDGFYSHPTMRDGHLNYCKDCRRRFDNQRRADNLDRLRLYDRQRAKTAARRAAMNKASNASKKRHREKHNARGRLATAIRKGVVKPESCWCGKPGQAHHPDYSKPLEVVWLCTEHHEGVHHAKA